MCEKFGNLFRFGPNDVQFVIFIFVENVNERIKCVEIFQINKLQIFTFFKEYCTNSDLTVICEREREKEKKKK